VNDSGFDTGSMDDTPPAFTGRILAMKNAHDPSLSVADTVSYGTAVAGYIVASGVCDEVGGDVSGIAPAARLVIQSLIGGDGNWPPVKLRGIFERPYLDQNVRIVNNSFGPAHGFQPAYGDTEEPNTIDHLVCEYPDLLFVNAAGNTGSDDETPRVAAFGSAKNAITVGASRSRRRQDQKGTPNPQGLCHSKTDIAPFSSAGPTRERFTSPHLMAPGTAIRVASSRASSDHESPWLYVRDKLRLPDDLWLLRRSSRNDSGLLNGVSCSVIDQGNYDQRCQRSRYGCGRGRGFTRTQVGLGTRQP